MTEADETQTATDESTARDRQQNGTALRTRPDAPSLSLSHARTVAPLKNEKCVARRRRFALSDYNNFLKSPDNAVYTACGTEDR